MKRLTKIMTAVTFAVSFPTFGVAASFNCAKASTANEIAICSDDELSTLDETLAAVYKQARGSVSDAKRLKSEQVNWIKSLGTCNGNVDCLISAYRNRVLVLDYLDGQVTATLDPLQDQVEQLNEREEILALRENALTTELRALNSAIEAFEEEKLAFKAMKEENLSSNKIISQTQESSPKQNCHNDIAGESLSLNVCAGFFEQSAKMFNQEQFYPNGVPSFFWEIDRACNYLPSLIEQSKEAHQEIGKAQFSVGVLAENVDGLKSTMTSCTNLVEHHSQ